MPTNNTQGESVPVEPIVIVPCIQSFDCNAGDHSDACPASEVDWKNEAHRERQMVRRAIHGLKWLGRFHRFPGEDPHPMDCNLAARVAQVFCMGYSTAIALCRKHEADPFWMEPRTKADL